MTDLAAGMVWQTVFHGLERFEGGQDEPSQTLGGTHFPKREMLNSGTRDQSLPR